jgi:hypothetical protein
MPVIPALGKLSPKNLKFEASLSYIDTVSKKQKKRKSLELLKWLYLTSTHLRNNCTAKCWIK